MDNNNLLGCATISVSAPVERVWEALTNPDLIKQYMFGTTVVSDWRLGSKILWKGEWKGKPYEDKGEILDIRPPLRLQYSHFSPMTGQPDVPENYHTVTIDLAAEGVGTHVSLSQDNNGSEEEKKHSEENWQKMLQMLKEVVEKNSA